MDEKETLIINFIKNKTSSSSKEIFDEAQITVSYATLKRILVNLKNQNLIITEGKGKNTKYSISPMYDLIYPINMDQYYKNEIDERIIKVGFNFSLIPDTLSKVNLFSTSELGKFRSLHNTFQKNIAQLSKMEYLKEFERLAIDLSWKSSQIEGNTYSLLETELLLKDKETASGKTKEEAIMLLNHKDAIDFIMLNPNYIHPLSLSKIEDIHSILIKDLGIDRNVRKKRIGISGTNYRPLDNEFQISEAISSACDLINKKTEPVEKALLALVLISYIQPFMDGNKRTARIVSNAILIQNNHCALSYRTVDSIEYKKAMLIFYEQNNISNFKEIFIQQTEFAVNTYF